MLEDEGTAVLPNMWNHSSDTALFPRGLESFKNAPYYQVDE
jgi:hypothetical protein